jgi:hypothetical protein
MEAGMIDLGAAASRLSHPEKQGGKYVADCPSCNAHAAWLMEGRDRKLKVGCFACNDWRAVKDAIGDDEFKPSQSTEPVRSPEERVARGQRYWEEAATLRGPSVSYLVKRAIEPPFPPTLRHHKYAWHFSGFFAALVGKIERFDLKLGFVFAGAHLTYLAPDGRKAGVDPDRLTFGVIKGAGVWMGDRDPDAAIVVGEGVESTLSGMKILGVAAGVAALSAVGMRSPCCRPAEARCGSSSTVMPAAPASVLPIRWRGGSAARAAPSTSPSPRPSTPTSMTSCNKGPGRDQCCRLHRRENGLAQACHPRLYGQPDSERRQCTERGPLYPGTRQRPRL